MAELEGGIVTVDPKSMRSTPVGYNDTKFGQPEYTDWMDECMSWKQTCYIGDWSFLPTRRYQGPDALKLFSDISVNSFAKYDIGQAKHVIHCHESGKVIHEGILSRLDDEEFVLFGRGTYWADYTLRTGKYRVTSRPDDLFKFQVSGPNAIHVVEKAAGASLRNIGFMRFATIRIAGHEIWALRQGMAGEVGYELQGPTRYRDAVYEAILQAGREYGIRRLGGRSNRVNHLEACFPTMLWDYVPAVFENDMAEYLQEFYAAMPGLGNTLSLAGSLDAQDISAWYRSPVELGWTKNIKFDHDFIGRAALEKEVAAPRRAIRTLVWNAEDVVDVYASLFQKEPHHRYMEIPRDRRGFVWQDKVLSNGKLVGISTSRGYSYYFREMISLCTVDLSHSEIGTDVTVIWGNPGTRQKEIRAKVAPAPYKSDNRRVDVAALQPMEVSYDR